MDSSSSTRPCYLSQLPAELLYEIFQRCPDISALWSLLTTSSQMLAVFNSRASEIVDAVLNLTVPAQTRLYMRQVLVLRTGIHSYYSFEDAQTDRFLLCKRIMATPDQLRTFVALSHRVHVLAHLCIEGCLRRCLASPLGQREYPVGFIIPTWTEEQRSILSFWRVLFCSELKLQGLKGHLNWSPRELIRLQSQGLYEHVLSGTARSQAMTALRFICEQTNPDGSEEELSNGLEQTKPLQLPTIPEGSEFSWTCQSPPSPMAVIQGWSPSDPQLPEPRPFTSSVPSPILYPRVALDTDSEDEEDLLTPAESEESESEELESDESESDGDESDGPESWGRLRCLFRIPEDRLIIVENPPSDPEIIPPAPFPIQGFGEVPSRGEWRTLHGATIGVQFWTGMNMNRNAGPGQYIWPNVYLKYGFAIWEEQRMIDMGLWSTEARVDASDIYEDGIAF
ncbi:hypothetical protein ABOM_003829 [Aspergillus bombycis]|uniref:F-box domain-containing protein n=1 Tax=Aspergillus bombycis TaxID=109264 RepID=A0A1F8A7E5_9EURO|nr:hypothetical protein ABOM_003829 [Aspergillus bombycis]OGM47285.1 hypothetical protein ABOM_003829 [Aspergillus bombycis]